MDGTTNSLHVFLKQRSNIDGQTADDFLAWSSKLRASLSIYNRAYLTSCWGKSDRRRPTTARPLPVRRGMPPNRIYSSTGGSAFFVMRNFEGNAIEGEAGHGQQAWAALREKFKGSSREAIRTEHSKMNDTRMRSDQDPDEYLYIMDSCRDRLNACDPPEGPADRQFEDVSLQALPPEYKSIRQAHLERGDFGLADIRCMMAIIYADNLARSRSDSYRGVAGRDADMQAMTRDDYDIKCLFCGRVGHFKIKCPLRVKHQQQENNVHQPQQREGQQNHVKDNKTTRADSNDKTVEAGEVPCGARTTTFHSDAVCRARRRKQADGNAHICRNGAFAHKGNLQRFRSSRRGRSAGTPLHLLHNDGGTSHGGNCSGAKPQRGNVAIQLTVSITSLDIWGMRQARHLFWSSGKIGLLHERGNGRRG